VIKVNIHSLGPGQHTQYSLKAMPQFSHTIVSVALGQDHTLAMTKSGEVLSWGLNRFSQLGYIVESAAAGEGFGRIEEPIQSIPKKIHGPLRKETVRGIAASKGASACWTNADVYTWGTNNGQLGMAILLAYDRSNILLQVMTRPRNQSRFFLVRPQRLLNQFSPFP
jgi:alpha-tubulin suppressor-like RCC1 family protein